MRVHPASSQEPYNCFTHHPEQPFSACWRVTIYFSCASPCLSIFLLYLLNWCCWLWCCWSWCCWSCRVVGMSTIMNLPLQQSFNNEPKRKRPELSMFRRKEEQKREKSIHIYLQHPSFLTKNSFIFEYLFLINVAFNQCWNNQQKYYSEFLLFI